MPALGPERCPWPIPWSHLGPSSPGRATDRRLRLTASACQEDLQPDSLPAGLFAPVFDYTRLFRMGGTLLRLEERTHVSIMGLGGRAAN
jgi:hypothetical protein